MGKIIENADGETKKTFWIPVVYSMYGHVPVKAETEEDAFFWAENNIDELPLPDDGTYLEESFEVDTDGLAIPDEEYKGY